MADSTNAQIGSQTKVYYWNTALTPDAWSQIPNVRQFGEVGADKPEVESTDLDSTGVERIGGLQDGKEISITCVANAVTIPLLKLLFDAGLNLDMRVIYPAPASYTEYFSLTPLGHSKATMTPSGLFEMTLRGRISGSIGTVAPH